MSAQNTPEGWKWRKGFALGNLILEFGDGTNSVIDARFNDGLTEGRKALIANAPQTAAECGRLKAALLEIQTEVNKNLGYMSLGSVSEDEWSFQIDKTSRIRGLVEQALAQDGEAKNAGEGQGKTQQNTKPSN